MNLPEEAYDQFFVDPERGEMRPRFDLFPKYGTDKFVLDENGEPKPEFNIFNWGRGYEDPRRVLIQHHLGRVKVSTVFLAINHDFACFSGGDPILWETMIFGGRFDYWQDRYASKEAALEGHSHALAMVLSKNGRKCRSHALKVLWKKYLKRYPEEAR